MVQIEHLRGCGNRNKLIANEQRRITKILPSVKESIHAVIGDQDPGRSLSWEVAITWEKSKLGEDTSRVLKNIFGFETEGEVKVRINKVLEEKNVDEIWDIIESDLERKSLDAMHNIREQARQKSLAAARNTPRQIKQKEPTEIETQLPMLRGQGYTKEQIAERFNISTGIVDHYCRKLIKAGVMSMLSSGKKPKEVKEKLGIPQKH